MQERAERTRRSILQSAAETFEARGYQGTRLQDVVAGTDVSKGALYFHFPSKEDLAAAILQEQHDLWPQLITELRQERSRAIEVLLELSLRVAGRFQEDVMLRASARLSDARDQIGASVPPLFDGWVSMIDELLAEAKTQGDLLGETDTKGVAELIVAAFAGCRRISEAGGRGADLGRRTRTMWRHLLPGLVVPARLPELGAVIRDTDDFLYVNRYSL